METFGQIACSARTPAQSMLQIAARLKALAMTKKRDLNEKVSWACPTLLGGYAKDASGVED